MLPIKTSAKFLISLLLILTMQGISCDIKSPTEGVRVLFNEDPLTLVTVEIVDARTQAQIVANSFKGVSITIEGTDKNTVTDLTEVPKTHFSAQSGFFSFAIAEEIQVSPENPVKITIIASSDGFITNSKQITITSTGETFNIALVQLNKPPEGVSTKTNIDNTADASGQVTESIVVATEPDPVTETAVSVHVPDGTIIKDEDGNALTGKLTTNVTYFNNKSEESLNALPRISSLIP